MAIETLHPDVLRIIKAFSDNISDIALGSAVRSGPV